jgi:hypothetical protein
LNVTGLVYQRALNYLARDHRFPARVIMVVPPGARWGTGELRVLAERETSLGLELYLTYEDYT